MAVFTGDLVNSRADELLEFMPVFSQLKARDGVYSVLGNHDYGSYVKWKNEQARLANVDSLITRENRMGWCMLQNDHRIIYKGTDSIAVVGVENSGKPPFPDRGDLPKALQGTNGMFKVLLSHDPTQRTVSGGQPGTVCQHWVRLCALPHALRCLAGNYHSHIKKRK